MHVILLLNFYLIFIFSKKTIISTAPKTGSNQFIIKTNYIFLYLRQPHVTKQINFYAETCINYLKQQLLFYDKLAINLSKAFCPSSFRL